MAGVSWDRGSSHRHHLHIRQGPLYLRLPSLCTEKCPQAWALLDPPDIRPELAPVQRLENHYLSPGVFKERTFSLSFTPLYFRST